MVFIKDKQVWTLNPMATSSLRCWSFTFCISHAHDLDILLPDSARPNFKGTPQNDGIHHHGPTSSTGVVRLCPTKIWGLKPYRAKLQSVRVYGLRPGLFSGNLPYWWPNWYQVIGQVNISAPVFSSSSAVLFLCCGSTAYFRDSMFAFQPQKSQFFDHLLPQVWSFSTIKMWPMTKHIKNF